MKKLFCVLFMIIMLFSLCSCEDPTPQENEYQPHKTETSKEHVDEFITLLKKEETSTLSSGYTFDKEHCYNVTPTEVATETDMKIFKFSDSCASFVMLENEIYPLCDYFGGLGFVNAIPCDFDNDGNKDLFVASSWGSGMHRSVISVFNSQTKKSTVLYDSSTTETSDVDLVVARSTANMFTETTSEKLCYSVLSVKIDVEDNNLSKLSYTINGIEGHIETENNEPVFIPYQK